MTVTTTVTLTGIGDVVAYQEFRKSLHAVGDALIAALRAHGRESHGGSIFQFVEYEMEIVKMRASCQICGSRVLRWVAGEAEAAPAKKRLVVTCLGCLVHAR